MNVISDFITGVKVLEVCESPVNGRITVIKSVAFGTYIQAGGLTQSGGILKSIWNKTLKSVRSEKQEVGKCLVLGLGGGSIIEVIKKYWPEANITAVDIDPLMVELGKKHLGLDGKNVEIIISDALDFLTVHSSPVTDYYDLICIDLYVGDVFPEKFESQSFLKKTESVLAPKGMAVFNRLYYGEKRSQAVKFAGTLEKIFSGVEVVYPEANVMYVCSK